jgi:hypothetical protein
MEKVKRSLRLLFLILFLTVAAFGIGLTGFLNNNRERYMDVEIRIENVDKKEEEEDGEDESER